MYDCALWPWSGASSFNKNTKSFPFERTNPVTGKQFQKSINSQVALNWQRPNSRNTLDNSLTHLGAEDKTLDKLMSHKGDMLIPLLVKTFTK